MDAQQTIRCSSCGSEQTYLVQAGQTIHVTHQCPDGWERTR